MARKKTRVTPKQKAARRRNIAVARKAKKKGLSAQSKSILSEMRFTGEQSFALGGKRHKATRALTKRGLLKAKGSPFNFKGKKRRVFTLTDKGADFVDLKMN